MSAENPFFQFKSDVESVIGKIENFPEKLRFGNNSIIFSDPKSNFSLVVEQNPMPVGGELEWALREDDEYIKRSEKTGEELTEFVAEIIKSIFASFGLSLVEIDAQTGNIYIVFPSRKYVFSVYGDGELVVGSVEEVPGES